MHAMILAAGRGERMRPLSDVRPKALLEVAGRPLIEWQILRLVAGGFPDVVINLAWLGAAIKSRLGSGKDLGARIAYSAEAEALDTLGGIVQALPLLGDQPFAVTSADIYTHFDYSTLAARIRADTYPDPVAHWVLTDNPPYHREGDMALEGPLVARVGAKLTYANIGVYHPAMFAGLAAGAKLKLFPWAYQFVDQKRVSGEYFSGVWHNVGTADDLHALVRSLAVPPAALPAHG